MRVGVIYKITCIENGYFLYRSTIKFEKRKSSYKSSLIKGNYSNIFLQRCFNKYGWNTLKFEIVQDNIPEDILLHVEDVWIGANCSKSDDNKGGMNMRNGYRWDQSIESREKIRQAMLGKKQSKETIQKRVQTMKENYKPRSIESRLKTSLKIMGKVNKNVEKQIYQFDINKSFIQSFRSITQEEKITGVEKSSISRAASGSLTKAGGFLWSFNQINIPTGTTSLQKVILNKNKEILNIFNNSNKKLKKDKIIEVSKILNINYYTAKSKINKLLKMS